MQIYIFFFIYNNYIYKKRKKTPSCRFLAVRLLIPDAKSPHKRLILNITEKISIVTLIFFFMHEKPKNKLILLLLS